MSGFLEDLNSNQAEALAKFKATVTDIPNKPEDNDRYYLRWLRARKFNVAKSLVMFRNHLAFREQYGVDTLLEHWELPEVVVKCAPMGHFGEDREGHPVWYANVGNVDPRGFLRATTREDRIRAMIMMVERILRVIKDHSEKKGPLIESITVIADVEHLSLQRHYYWPALRVGVEGMRIFEANYPEIVHRILVVKSPKVLPLFYNLAKPIIDKQTRDKIVFLSGNWKEELQKYISPDQLPQAYGGTRCEPDEWCTNFINPGCDVPPELYLTNQMETERQEMDRVVVGRGGSCELEYKVELESSLIRWEFISTGYDISYGLLQKESTAREKPKLEPVVPFKKVDSHLVPETGTYTCVAPGKYVFKFDNSYSWVHSKEVFYSIRVLPPTLTTEPDPPDLTADDVTTTTGNSSDDEFHDCVDDLHTDTVP